uniref:Uncharacterized protein n=1 Tax=Neolamprologus brichardi TaxID=32507 RepID=A0A3Q4HYL5_NEOBR
FHFFSVFVNYFCLPSVYGLQCYTCWGVNPGSCTRIWTCPQGYDYWALMSAFSNIAENMITKECCSEDLSPLAIITLFI